MFFDRLRFSIVLGLCMGVFACSGLTNQTVSATEREIAWTEDYDGAVQRAAASNSILLLHFYGDYCPPCKLLDKKTFKDPALVSAINSTLVPVKINADRRRDLAEKYNVNRWPTDVYLFPNGDELYRGISDQDPAVYTQKIKRLALRHRDWTLERQAIAKTIQRRQDKELAANTPLIQSEKPVYAGSSGVPVKSQAASWQTPTGSAAQVAPFAGSSSSESPSWVPQELAEAPSNSTSAPKPVGGRPAPIVQSQSSAQPTFTVAQTTTKPHRVIDNPFIAKEPLVVPVSTVPANPASAKAEMQKKQPAVLSAAPAAPAALEATEATEAVEAVEANVARRSIPARPISSELTLSSASEMLAEQKNSSQPSISPTASNQNSTEPSHIVADSIGLEGHCPVELIESLAKGSNPSWVSGSSAFAVRHRGRIYHCSSERARQTLLSSPDRFTPCLSCFDLVYFFETGKLIDGKCEFGCIQPNTKRVFLFASKENLEAFDRDNQRYAQLIDHVSPERVARRTDETRIR